MATLCEKVMASCDLSEHDAVRELECATDCLMADGNIDNFCTSLGIDEEDLFENPEALLAYM